MEEKSKKRIIGIIGTIGSGKDTVADYISRKLNIPAFEVSQPLKDLAKERGIEPFRENLIKLGTEVSKERGPSFFIDTLANKTSENLIIITGARIPAVVEYMRGNYDLILLSITAETEIRFKRSIDRNKLGEATTLTEFINREQKENSAPNEQRLFDCLTLADYSIENNGNMEELKGKVDEFLKIKSFI